MTADMLLEQTSQLRAQSLQKEADLLVKLAQEGQQPRIMFVGCADSRVIPEMLAGARPGEIFVVRNIANVIPPSGVGHHSVGAALEYAVEHLKIAHLVVCGHTECGGIKALDGRIRLLEEPCLGRWIEYARDAQRRVERQSVPPDQRHRAVVEQNVLLQLEHAVTYPPVRKAVDEKRLELHGWVFDLHGPRVYAYNFETRAFETA